MARTIRTADDAIDARRSRALHADSYSRDAAAAAALAARSISTQGEAIDALANARHAAMLLACAIDALQDVKRADEWLSTHAWDAIPVGPVCVWDGVPAVALSRSDFYVCGGHADMRVDTAL